MKKSKTITTSKTSVSDIPETFPVAGIGASAGGLEAFKTLIKSIPNNSGIAWVLVQHQHPAYDSVLTELLQKITTISVIEITHGLQLKANHIYVMPANKMLTVKNGKFKLTLRPKNKIEGNYPINLFFTTLAQAYESNAIGVVLSGTASDGTKGLQAIKEHGGITIAQSIPSSAYPGMPESAISAGFVDFILAPEKIPNKLLEIKKIISINEEKKGIPEEQENSFREILSMLHMQRGMDFTYYKQTTIRRRILRRMVLNKNKNIGEYATYLKENKNEINALYQDMLIPVTSFFRDEKVFENLCETVFPTLIKNKAADGIIRIWVAGCSTGEEAYSIAICFNEYLGHRKEKVQIFATDLSEPAITKARSGIYTKGEAEMVSHGRLKKFFTISQGNYLVNKDLRDICVFAVHNFLKDPPFMKIDFITCRNVLIYLDTYLQKKALATFHYALNPHGLLMLGKSENTVGITDLFIAYNKTEKIFTRKNVTSKIPFVITKPAQPAAGSIINRTITENLRTDFQKMTDDLMLAKYTPAAVVVNETLDIVHLRGNISLYLELSAGKPTHNLLKIAKPDLAFELRSIMYKAIKEKKAVKKENIPVQFPNENRFITLEAVPLANIIEPHWVIIFNENATIKSKTLALKKSTQNTKDEEAILIQQQEAELAQLREDMRSIADEQEATNEELQSSNEEMQSLNEELETSKEELQSTVEELTVVNQEMINLNEQLASEKEYADAVIATIPQPLLILDKDLRVTLANQLFFSKFLINKSQTEEKLVYEIGNRQWDIPKLRTLLEEIIPDKKSLLGFEVEHIFENIGQRNMRLNAREITRVNGEKRILLVIEDVTDYVEAARKIQESEHRYANMIYSSPFMIAILEGKDMIIKNANDAILQTWNKTKTSIGKPLIEVLPEARERGTEARIKSVFETGIPYYGYEVPAETIRNGKKEIAYYSFIYQAQRDLHGQVEGVAIIAHEVTSQAELNNKIKQSEQKFQAAVAAVEGVVWTNNAQGEMVGEQPGWAALTGQTYEEYQGYGWAKAVHPDDAQPTVNAWQEAVSNKSIFIFEHRVKAKDGTWRHFSIRAIPLKDADDNITEWVGVHTDITEKLQAQQAIIESEEKFRTMAESSDILIGVNNETIDAVYFNKPWEKLTGRSVDDLLKLGWADLLHPEDKEPFMQKFLTAFENKASYEGEFRMLNKEGTYSWLYAKVQVRLHPDGSYAGHISSCIDITERKKNEHALKESEEKTRVVIESSPFPIGVYMGKDLIIEFANQAILDIWGKGNNVIGKPYREVLPELVNQQIFEQLDEVLNTGVSFHAKNQKVNLLIDEKLQPYYFNYDFTPLYNEAGQVYAVMNTAADVTDLNLAKQKTEEAQEQFSTLADNMENLAWTADGEGWIYWYNKRWYDYTGTTLEEMQGWGWQKVHHPDHKERVIEFVKKAWHINEPFELTFPLLGADGNYRWFLTRAFPKTDESGKIIRWLGTNTDITKQIETEQRLSLLSTIVESSGDAIISKTLNSIITTWNKGAEQMFGYAANEVLGKHISILIPEELQQEEDMVISNIKNGKPVHYETVRRAKDGRKINVSLSVSPVKDKDGNIIGASKIARDITEQVIARKKIEESEEQFRVLSDQAPMWVWLTDKALNILYANTELLKFIGISDHTQFTGHVWEQKVHAGELPLIYQLFNEAVALQKPFEIECRILNATTGLYEWFFIKGVPRYEADTFTGFIGTGININEQKLVLNQLEYRKALLEAHNEASLDGILLVDTKGKIISYNHRFIEIWNMPQHITDINDDEAALKFATTQLINPSQFIEKVKWLYNHPDEISIDELEFINGKIIQRHGSPVKAPNGSYYAWSWIFRDITEQRESERAIKESEANFRRLAEEMPQKIVNTDPSGKVYYFNKNWLDYTGLSHEELYGDGWAKTIHPDDLEQLKTRWMHSVETGIDFEMEHRIRNKEGAYIWHINRSVPVKNDRDEISHWIGSATEIQKIKEEVKRREDFLKMVSHELKTPITSIKGYVQLLLSLISPNREINLSEIPLQPSLVRIDKQIIRLTKLISELLDVGRLVESKLVLKVETFNIKNLVIETVEDVLHTTSTHTINITHNIDAEINGDRDRIQQVLINFINNAIKYSPVNRVVELFVNKAENNHVAVSVKDFGIGINAADNEKIFERFYRVEGKNEETFSGFGIGLFIAREIIEKHQGKITVESLVGQGSVFTFILPLAT